LFDHLFGFIHRVHGEGDDIDILPFELVHVSLVIGQLPNAVGSPDAAVENDNRVFSLQVLRDIEFSAIG
jgi:hypothetical protein